MKLSGLSFFLILLCDYIILIKNIIVILNCIMRIKSINNSYISIKRLFLYIFYLIFTLLRIFHSSSFFIMSLDNWKILIVLSIFECWRSFLIILFFMIIILSCLMEIKLFRGKIFLFSLFSVFCQLIMAFYQNMLLLIFLIFIFNKLLLL